MLWLLFVSLALATPFNYCCQQEGCRENFGLLDCSDSYRALRFEKLYNRLSQETGIATESLNTEQPCCQALLQSYSFCGHNEGYDENGNCQCKSGKICQFSSGTDATTSIGVQVLVASVFALVALYITHQLLGKLKEEKQKSLSSILQIN